MKSFRKRNVNMLMEIQQELGTKIRLIILGRHGDILISYAGLMNNPTHVRLRNLREVESIKKMQREEKERKKKKKEKWERDHLRGRGKRERRKVEGERSREYDR